MTRDLTLFVSAGELSGDLYASEIIKRVRKKHPHCQVVSLGGQLSRQAGAQLLADTVSMATFGIWELFVTLRQWKKVWLETRHWIQEYRPCLVLIIDNPGFNLRLARFCREEQVPVLSFVPPQVWVWGAKRARTLARTANRILTLFPWEEEYFNRWKGRVNWVGHPLTRLVPLPKPSTDPGRSGTIVFLPGSRLREILHFIEVLVPLLSLFYEQWGRLDLVIVLSCEEFRELFSRVLSSAHSITLVDHEARYQALQGADLCITTCGTVTLEVALSGVPQVIVYRVSRPTYWIGRRLIKRRYFGLPNIVMNREVVPELIQYDYTARKVFQAVETIRDNLPRFQSEARFNAQAIRARLSRGDAFDNVVSVIEEFLIIGDSAHQ